MLGLIRILSGIVGFILAMISSAFVYASLRNEEIHLGGKIEDLQRRIESLERRK